MKKILALVLVAVMMMAFAVTANAASITINSTADSNEAATDITVYTYYKILDAEIEDASKITVDQDTGESTAATTGDDVPKVSYYVTDQTKATALTNLKVSDAEGAAVLFTVTKDATQDKWYVALADDSTTAGVIAARLDTIKSTFSDASGTFGQTTVGGTATADNLDPGYYLITSTLGDELVVQTLADVTINTKNDYPTVDKEVASEDDSAQIGDTINYTLTVVIPTSATSEIVLTDTMTAGLTFSEVTSVNNGTDDLDGTSDGEVYTVSSVSSVTSEYGTQQFTITFPAATVAANKGNTLTITYKAILNENAVVASSAENDDGNDNTVQLAYGNKYTSLPKTVETDTQSFTFDKVDGSERSTKLPGAIFELRLSGTALPLIEVTAGVEYRIASATEIADNNVTKVTQMTTNGNVITVKGVDGDVTYQLVETQAPTGYNLPENPSTDVTAEKTNILEFTIENNKGSVLPSTGGIGTTIFYVGGSILVLLAVVLLVTRRRMAGND